MNWLLTLPIIIPLLTTIAVLFSWHKLALQRLFTLCGTAWLLINNLYLLQATLNHHYLVTDMGNWPAPFGIVLVSDVLSSSLALMQAFVALCVALYSFTDIDRSSGKAGFYPAFNILLAGLSGAFLTGDLFNLYVWFEVILISSFVLLALNADNFQLESGVKYAVLNLISTLILLTAIAFLYGTTGTLNMADLAITLNQSSQVGLITIIASIFIVAFSMKAALFPLFFWLPASYHTPSYSTSAIFAGLLSKVGVYALFRTFTLLFLKNAAYLHAILLVLALFTLLIGILAALSQNELRRILSFSLISHIGFMIVGLALFTPLALIGSIFYLLQHILVKTNLFLSSGVVANYLNQSESKKPGGLYQLHPYFSILFFISLFSLAGIPPLSGFWGKLMLITASFQAKSYVTLAVILTASFLTLYVAARIWQVQFLRASTPPITQARLTTFRQAFLLLPITLLTLVILSIGLIPMPLYHLAQMASYQLLHPDLYTQAVLGKGLR